MTATIGKNEDILLRMDGVKSKKNGDVGVLYALANRLMWVDEKNGAGSISHKYEDIRVQKISPEGKSKVQLQVVLNNGDNTTFQFVGDGGAEKQLKDREALKELLQQLLPRFRNRLSQDIEQKQKILEENKELFRLYKELVTTAVISSDEFWQTYAAEKLNHKTDNNAQKIGVSTGFLSDVTKNDGCNGVRLNLTADIMEAIFRTYPSVKKKHLAMVPDQMTEKDFWTQFFQSHYFHRDRNANPTPKELFADCAKFDEEDLQSQIKATTEKARGGLPAYDDDRGLADQVNQLDDDDRGKIRNPAYTALLRRFNYHSSRVLQACLGDDGASTSGLGNAQTSAYSLGSLLPTTSRDYDESAAGTSKKRKLMDCDELIEEPGYEGITLTLARSEKYQQQHDGNSSPNKTDQSGDFTRNDAVRWCGLVSKCVEKRMSQLANADEILTADTALRTLMDLTTTPNDRGDADRRLPKLEDMRSLYAAANELLRHFWCCFPTTSPELEQKANKMYETLRRYEEAKLKPFLERSRLQAPGQANPADHISRMLQVALDKYRLWKERSATAAIS